MGYARTSRRFVSLLLCVACGPFAIVACSSGGSDPASVTLAGAEFVVVGGSTQFSASTLNGTDSSYAWKSSNTAVVVVSAEGLVTGTGKGTAEVSAEGGSTRAIAQLTITVDFDPSEDVPFYDDWKESGHADPESPAFKRFEDGVPQSCAKCHSQFGFQDFLGEDGSVPGEVNSSHPGGSVVDCTTCHNNAALDWDTVQFPSGAVVSMLKREATCMECHQGRRSMADVDSAIDAQMPADDDTEMTDQGAVDMHYAPAAVTRYGSEARAGYQYDGKTYDVYWRHAEGAQSCQECHDPHTTEILVNKCQQCHPAAISHEVLKDIRMVSSATIDYDGDGDLSEGISGELDGVQATLLTVIQSYARDTLGRPIAYSEGAWYVDANDNGIVDPEETDRYFDFTPRLLKATYNYRFIQADHGAFAHNAKYMIQLSHDSIEDVNAGLAAAVPFTGMRNDRGHFDGTADAFRHFDDDGEVQASCAKCHSSSEGFVEFATYGANTSQPIANGFDCSVCHTTLDTFELRRILTVTFPSGFTTEPATGPSSDPAMQSNLCITCHQGRTSKVQIDEAIANNKLAFQDIHYLAAAATLFGNLAQGGYEYDGNTYAGQWPHSETATNNNCTNCHNPGSTQHTFDVNENIAYCLQCHPGVTTVFEIRVGSDKDYNGNGDNTEPLRDELQPIAADLLVEIQKTARANGKPLCYEEHSYPYWFNDTNDNGVCDPGEAIFPNRYTDWTPDLIKAAHNYQHSQREPGAWAHNFAYITQLVIDSFRQLGGDPAKHVRPGAGGN